MKKLDKIKNIDLANKRLLKEAVPFAGNPNTSEPKRVSYDVMIHKLNMGRELGEPDLSQMVDEVITDLTAYLDDTHPLRHLR